MRRAAALRRRRFGARSRCLTRNLSQSGRRVCELTHPGSVSLPAHSAGMAFRHPRGVIVDDAWLPITSRSSSNSSNGVVGAAPRHSQSARPSSRPRRARFSLLRATRQAALAEQRAGDACRPTAVPVKRMRRSTPSTIAWVVMTPMNASHRGTYRSTSEASAARPCRGPAAWRMPRGTVTNATADLRGWVAGWPESAGS